MRNTLIALTLVWDLAAPVCALSAGQGMSLAPERMQAARALVQRLEEISRELTNPQERALLVFLAKWQARVGDVPGAVRSLGAAPRDLPVDQNRLFAVEDVAASQVHAGDIAGALSTLGSLPPEGREAIEGAIAREQLIMGDLAGAKATLATNAAPWVRHRAVVEAAERQLLTQDYAGALQTLTLFPDAHDNPKTLVMRAAILARLGEIAEATRLAGAINPSSNSRVLAFLGIVGFQARHGDLEGALRNLQEIPPGQWRDMARINLIAGTARRGEHARARSLADGMLAGEMRGVAHAALARMYVRAGDLQSALGSVESMENSLQDEGFEGIAEELARRGEHAAARETAGRMSQSGKRELVLQRIAAHEGASDAPKCPAPAPEKSVRTAIGPAEAWADAVACASAGDASRIIAIVEARYRTPAERMQQLFLAMAQLLGPPAYSHSLLRDPFPFD